MREELLTNLDKPEELERMFRSGSVAFTEAFDAVYAEIAHHPTARVWHARLHYEAINNSPATNTRKLLYYWLVPSILLAGFFARLPILTSLSKDFFYSRNIGFIILPLLGVLLAVQHKASWAWIRTAAGAILFSAAYINILPDADSSDTLILACIHLPLFLWAVVGALTLGNDTTGYVPRMAYLRFNGDLVVMSALLGLAAGLLLALTFGLFGLIEVDIEFFFEQYLVFWGAPALPLVAAFLITIYPGLVQKLSPLIARIFTPLVLVMLTLFLLAAVYTGSSPYTDREFLLLFNIILIGVMALICFAMTGKIVQGKADFGIWLLFLLAIVALMVNSVALSAIAYRIGSWGITPNRMAVLGGNLLMMVHLVSVSFRLFQAARGTGTPESVDKSIAGFLPWYMCWAAIVVFVFPVLFGFA